MHDHDKHGSGMMLIMALCCGLPILLLVFFGGKAISGSAWLILGAMAIAMTVHFFMMNQGREKSDKESDKKDENGSNSKHCCH